MKLYFVFSAPIVGPISEMSGGLGDLAKIIRDEDEAKDLCRRLVLPGNMGCRVEAWLNSVDTETLEVSETEWFGS